MAVSLKKTPEEHKSVEASKPSPDKLPEYTPVHLIDEEESIRRSAPPKKADTTSVIGSLPECTPVHLHGEGETQQSPNSGETVKKSKIPLAIVAVVAFVAVIALFAGSKGNKRNVVTPVLPDSSVSVISSISEPIQSSTSTSSEQLQQNNASAYEQLTQPPASNTSGYGTMGSVTIMGVEHDIATTT